MAFTPLRIGVLLLWTSALFAAPPAKPAREGEIKGRYFFNRSAATQFCPPIRTAFADAASTTTRAPNGRPFNQHPNGGYGLALMEVQGQSLLHTGADLGWFRQGEPVFAIADGVVRLSQPAMRAMAAQRGVRIRARGPVDYGNIIVIEHQLSETESCLTLYAHLGDDRLVSPGDLVMAGQQIGTIGRDSPLVNGGYKPHLHFGVRTGAWLPPGRRVLQLQFNGEPTEVRLLELGEDRARVALTPDVPGAFEMSLRDGDTLKFTPAEEGGHFLPAWYLYHAPPPTHFAGYAPDLEGWRDPLAFLREQGAAGSPAPYLFITPTHIASESRINILGGTAPTWKLTAWVRPAEVGAADAPDFAGKVVVLVCFDPHCRGSQTHGLPILEKLAQHYRGDPDVAVVGLHTVVTNNRRNTLENLKQLADRLPSVTHLGFCDKAGKAPPMIDDYQICGTPWLVLIDRRGLVALSNFILRPEEIILRADELKTTDVLVDPAPDA